MWKELAGVKAKRWQPEGEAFAKAMTGEGSNDEAVRGDKGKGDRGSIGLQNQNPDCCRDHSWNCSEKDLNCKEHQNVVCVLVGQSSRKPQRERRQGERRNLQS